MSGFVEGDGGFVCASYLFGRSVLVTRVKVRMASRGPVMLRAKLESDTAR